MGMYMGGYVIHIMLQVGTLYIQPPVAEHSLMKILPLPLLPRLPGIQVARKFSAC